MKNKIDNLIQTLIHAYIINNKKINNLFLYLEVIEK